MVKFAFFYDHTCCNTRTDKEGANVDMERNGKIKHDAHHALYTYLCTIKLHRLPGLPYPPHSPVDSLHPFSTLSNFGNLSIVPTV